MRPGACLIALVLCLICLADVVRLSNGDRLTGKVVRMENGTLTMDGELFKRVQFPFDSIVALQTDDPIDIVLVNQRRFSVRVVAINEDGELEVVRPDGEEFTIALSEVAAINPVPISEARWEGSASLGLSATETTKKSQRLDTGFELQRDTERERTRFGGTYQYGQQTDAGGATSVTEDSWLLRGQYDRFFHDRYSSFLNVRVGQDNIQDLDLRLIVGGGIGLEVIDDGTTELTAEIGLNSITEKFSDGTAQRDSITGQLGYRLRSFAFEPIEIINDLAVYPDFADLENYFLVANLILRTPLADNLFADLKVAYEFDSTPSASAKKDRIKYVFSIGYRF